MYPDGRSPRIWGMCRHGLVSGGEVTDCADKTHTYTQPNSPDYAKVQHSRAKLLVFNQEDYDDAVEAETPVVYLTPEQVAADAAAGVEWTDYDMLSGRNRVLAGYELGQYRWVYCDDNRAWIVEYVYDDTASPDELQIWLRGVFGGPEGLKTFDRKIGTMTVCAPGGGCDFEYSSLYANFSHTTSLRGDRCVIVDRYFSSTTVLPGYEVSRYQFVMNGPRIAPSTNTNRRSDFSASFVVTLSGNGSTVEATRGQGISATITVGYAETGYGGDPSSEPSGRGYLAQHWTNEDGTDTTLWALATYVMDDPDPGINYTGRVITLPDETTITDDTWIADPGTGNFEGTIHWNGDSLAGGGTSLMGDDYLGFGRDMVLIVRPGNEILAVHRTGITYGPVAIQDTTNGSDFFVYDPVHDEWSQHTGTAPVGVA